MKCPNWPLQAVVSRYELGCPEGFACRLCHGWKEFEYHPSRIKTTDCRRCASPTQSPDPLETIMRHICCFRHDWDTIFPPKVDLNKFDLVPSRKPLGRNTTRDYFAMLLPEISTLPILPRPAPNLLVDFIELTPHEKRP